MGQPEGKLVQARPPRPSGRAGSSGYPPILARPSRHLYGPLYSFLAKIPLPLGFMPPCLPTPSRKAPSGSAWVHEIKHDGYRLIARWDGNRVRALCEKEIAEASLGQMVMKPNPPSTYVR